MQWTGGVFFFNEKNDQPTRQDILATGSTNTISQKTSAAAVYGQADYKFDAVWKATGGLRYSSETKDMSIVSIRTNGTQAFQLAKKETWTRADWKVGLDAQLNQDVLAYATAATGFKSGGFNGRAASVAAFTTLKPEIVTSYEIGMKTTIADGRVRFNLDYYLNDYKDLQLTAFDTNGLAVLTNAASATLKGVEVEATAQITSAWQLSGNLGTIDGKYKDYTAANAATFAGKPLKQAPKQQWGLGTSYRLRVGKDAIIFNASAKHVGDHYQNLAASELIKTSAYTLVDARVGYEANGGKWALALWGKNLSDKQYYTGGFDIAGIGIASAYINVPRTYGVDFRYRFY
ncbi:MAG: TonB-dependent receptor [Betaproteobacteria bacterium]|nr:TonB-dependent receptor [Betaproteobacteria bacterium]